MRSNQFAGLHVGLDSHRAFLLSASVPALRGQTQQITCCIVPFLLCPLSHCLRRVQQLVTLRKGSRTMQPGPPRQFMRTAFHVRSVCVGMLVVCAVKPVLCGEAGRC
jgi:hypothetical protein